MKKLIFIISLAFLLTILFLRFTMPEREESISDVNRISKFKIPDDVQPIIKKSCFGCHNKDSKNDKAKAKLLFDELEKMPKAKLGGVLIKINEEVKKDDMPPPKFLEKFTDAKPTDAEKQKLITWSDEESGKMMRHHKTKTK
jgi:hypothetical protein